MGDLKSPPELASIAIHINTPFWTSLLAECGPQPDSIRIPFHRSGGSDIRELAHDMVVADMMLGKMYDS